MGACSGVSPRLILTHRFMELTIKRYRVRGEAGAVCTFVRCILGGIKLHAGRGNAAI